MPNQLTQDQLLRLYPTAKDFTKVIFEHTTSERGVHVETAVHASFFLAGTLILRSTGLDLSRLKVGQPVLTAIASGESDDIVNDTGQQVLAFMRQVCPLLSLDPDSGWGQPVPPDNKPLQAGIDLVRKIEAPFIQLANKGGISQDKHAYVAAFAGMFIVQMGQQALHPDISKAIALESLVAGCKTVPYPFSKDGN